jgi:pimeloyl-ACP methyl ester carboxylesterase
MTKTQSDKGKEAHMDIPDLEHVTLPTNGIRLHVVQSGSRYGSLVILLHGFPEFWYGWRRQIQPLAAAGMRVWVPDQRGYNLSDKPLGIAAYRFDELANDVIGLIDSAGIDKCCLVGHDWGAAVAWWVALKHPERLNKLAILNVPHPAVMVHTLTNNLEQLRRSWYIFFFQIPFLTEAILRNDDCGLMVKMLLAGSAPGSFTAADIDKYRQAWWRKRAISSMLNWYRAALHVPPDLSGDMHIKVPTLMLWGAQDSALIREMAQPSLDLCEEGKLVVFETSSHWVQHDASVAVNRYLVDFLTA